jgi:hypothetical protein
MAFRAIPIIPIDDARLAPGVGLNRINMIRTINA